MGEEEWGREEKAISGWKQRCSTLYQTWGLDRAVRGIHLFFLLKGVVAVTNKESALRSLVVVDPSLCDRRFPVSYIRSHLMAGPLSQAQH